MTDDPQAPRNRQWVRLVVRDIQFWVPVAVLCGGVLVLLWIR
jgi:hypothetical protein